MISKVESPDALAAGDALDRKRGQSPCASGRPPAQENPIFAAALGLALVEKGWRVLFTRTTDLVQKLQLARRDLALEAAIAKLDKYHLLILDDLAYIAKDQAETSVLFELIGARGDTISADHGQPTVQRMGQDLPRTRHDARRHRPPGPSRYHPRNECRQLSKKRGDRQGPRSSTSANASDTEKTNKDCCADNNEVYTVHRFAISSRRDNHQSAATVKIHS